MDNSPMKISNIGLVLILASPFPAFSQENEQAIPYLPDTTFYSPEEAVEFLKSENSLTPGIRIDFERKYQSPSSSPFPASPSLHPIVVTPIDISGDSNEFLAGDVGIATATAMHFGTLNHRAGDRSEANIELISIIYGLTFQEATTLIDFATTVIESSEEIANVERRGACNGVALSGNVVADSAAIRRFLMHFDRISENTTNYFLNVYLELPSALPESVADKTLDIIDQKRIRSFATNFEGQFLNDHKLAGDFIREYCQAHLSPNNK